MAQILGTGFQRAGKNSRVNVDGSILAFAKWDITYKGDDLDTCNFDSEGFEEGILGFIGLEWSFGGDWDASLNSFDNPPGLYPRDDLPTVQIFENVIDDVVWEMPYARVRSARNGCEVKGKISFEASGMSQGTFTVPTGSV